MLRPVKFYTISKKWKNKNNKLILNNYKITFYIQDRILLKSINNFNSLYFFKNKTTLILLSTNYNLLNYTLLLNIRHTFIVMYILKILTKFNTLKELKPLNNNKLTYNYLNIITLL